MTHTHNEINQKKTRAVERKYNNSIDLIKYIKPLKEHRHSQYTHSS